MFETAIAGSLPKPEWLAETNKLWPKWMAEGDSLKQAKATVKAIEGDPIEVRLVPLYPAITNEDLK